jgi:hypothetical protein
MRGAAPRSDEVIMAMRVCGWLVGMSVLLVWGCQTSEPAQRGPQGGGGGMMGLEDAPPKDFWSGWQPQTLPLVLPAGVEASAFDAWRVTDEGFTSRAWGAIFVALDFVRTQPGTSPELQKTLRLLQATLEPSPDQPSELDVTFIAARSGAWEGLVVRLWHTLPSGGVPGVAIFLRREAGEQLPSRMWLWAVSGHQPAGPLSARLDQLGGMATGPGIALLDTAKGAPASGADVVLQVVRVALWEPCIGEEYAEPTLKRARRGEAPLLPAMPPALGLKVHDRDIEQVMPDTAFVPTIDDEDLPF